MSCLFSAATAAASTVQEEAAKTEADDDDEEGEELKQADDVDKTEEVEPGGWHTVITLANVLYKVLKCFYWFYNNYRQSCQDAKWAFELEVIFYILSVYIKSKLGNPVN